MRTGKEIIHSNNLGVKFHEGYFHLFYKDNSLTDSIGVYSSFLINGSWHESSHVDWFHPIINSNNDGFIFEGKYRDIPLTISWTMKFASENKLSWEVGISVTKSIKIDEIVLTVLLPFDRYSNGNLRDLFDKYFDVKGETWIMLYGCSINDRENICAESRTELYPSVRFLIKDIYQEKYSATGRIFGLFWDRYSCSTVKGGNFFKALQ